MENDEIIFWLILLGLFIILFGGAQTVKPKDSGERCMGDTECLSNTCEIPENNTYGSCDMSEIDEKCNSIDDCKMGICKNSICALSGFLGECNKDEDCENANSCLKNKCVNDKTLRLCESLSPIAHFQIPFFIIGLFLLVGSYFGLGRTASVEARGIKITGASLIGVISIVIWFIITFIC